MREATDPLLNLVKRGKEPAVVQTVRSTAAAVISYVVALHLSSEPVPLTAPLTALLVVQVTLYATIRTGISRVNAVVAGVLIAIGFSALVGLTWWSLGLIILAALTIGRFVKAGDFLVEVAISAMLVLGVTQAAGAAWDRVLETLIGAVVGLLFNTLFVPPVWVSTAGESLLDLSGRMCRLASSMQEQLARPVSVAEAATKLHEARRLDNDIADVDAALRQAEDSLRLNPRVKEGLLSRVVLRTGLDTLEICSVVLRVSSRTLTDLAKARAGEPLFPAHIAAAFQEMYTHIGGAFQAFAVLITSQVSANAEDAESRLTEELAAGRKSRDQVADMLLDLVQAHPGQWQLHGALLAEADRILDEMDVEKRSARLVEELDLRSREMQDKYPRLTELRRRLRNTSRRLRRRR
ncbi:FUSC family protein [Streptomyces sp. SGAir0957]